MKWTDPDDAEILVEFIHPTARGLDAWVELRLPGDPVPIVEGTRDLMRPDAIDPFLKGARTLKAPGQWLDGLRVAFHTVIEQHRDGADTIDLAAVDPAPLQFLVDPLLENGGSTRLIAAGGSGKSLFAMAVCLTIATGRRFLGLDTTVTGPTLFLDWETPAVSPPSANRSTHQCPTRVSCCTASSRCRCSVAPARSGGSATVSVSSRSWSTRRRWQRAPRTVPAPLRTQP